MSQKRTSDNKSENAKLEDVKEKELEAMKDGLPIVEDYWTMVAKELERLKGA